MGVHQVTVYRVQCDNCNAYYATNEDLHWSGYDTKREALNEASGCDWYVSDDDSRVLCEDCRSWSEEERPDDQLAGVPKDSGERS